MAQNFAPLSRVSRHRPNYRATVLAQVRGDRLVLPASGVTLRLSRVGPSRLSPVIDAVGYMWRVEALTDEHGPLTIPRNLTGALGFDRFGFLYAKDTVHRMAVQFGLSDEAMSRVVWSGSPSRIQSTVPSPPG